MPNDETNLPAIQAPQELSPQDVKDRLDKVMELMRLAMNKGEDYGVIPGTKRPTLLKPGAEKLLLMMRLDPEYDAKTERWDGIVAVVSTCTLFRITTGERMGSGMGACDSTERGRERAPFNTILKIANKRALVAAVLNVTGASQIFTQDVEDGGDEAAVGDGGRRKASGRGAHDQSPPARPGPDELADVKVRAALWRTVVGQLGREAAGSWMQERMAEFGLTDAKQLRVGQIATLYERLQNYVPPSQEALEAGMPDAGPDAGIGNEEPDISY